MAYSAEKDLFPFVGTDQDTDIILFFTDNRGEPKKLNIRRCIEDDVAFSGNALGYAGADLEDFITACPKVPSKAIQFAWNKNVDFESNFQETNGIQFAYQNVYIDGFVTAISPLSEVAFPPSVQNLGSSSLSSVTVESECILQIPQQGPEISKIRILFREGNDGSFKMIDEISNVSDVDNDLFDYSPDGTILGYYTFRNDSVYPIVPSSRTAKNFDNLPRRAKAQSVSGNRLMYGNYLEGFNPIQTSATGTAILSNVNQQLVSVEGQINTINVFADGVRNGGARGESIGFSVDVGTENIKPGIYKLSVNLSPEQNYHLFNAKAYFPSKNQTFNGESDYTFDGLATTASGDIADGLFKILNKVDGSTHNVEATDGTKMLYGYDPGRPGIFGAQWQGDDGSMVTNVGTTAANPLIIPGAPLSVSITIEVLEEIASSVLLSEIDSVISSGSTQSIYVSLLDYSGAFLDGSAYGFTSADLAKAPGVRAVVESRSGLTSKDEFNANSTFADRICFVPYYNSGEATASDITGAPAGFFIVNKADMLLNVKRVDSELGGSVSPTHSNNSENPQTATKAYYRFEVVAIRNPEILTCLPEPVSGLGYADSDAELNEYLSAPYLPWALSSAPSAGTNTNVAFKWPLVLGDATQQGGQETYPSRTFSPQSLEYDGADFNAFGGSGQAILSPSWGFPVPTENDQTYVFWNSDGIVFTAVASFDTVLTQPRVTITNPVTMIANEDIVINDGNQTITSNWFLEKYYGDSPETSNPNFPKGAAIKDRDGNYLTFDLTAVSGQICPIAIGKWKVFSANDIADGTWQNSFEYTWINSDGDNVIVKPSSTSSWFGPMSNTWAGRDIAVDDFMSINDSSQDVGGTFTSIIDGAAGVGSLISGENGYSKVSDSEVFLPITAGDYSGDLAATSNFVDANSGTPTPVSNRRGTIWNTTLIGIHENFKFIKSDAITDGEPDGYNTPTAPTDQEITAAPLQDLGSFFDIGIEGSSISSFKTRDFHDFGVVYFDKRGRAGSVNTLPSVYVPGYSNSERGQDEKGKVAIRYSLNHLPPDWADSYKIVYAGSANTERFIQYSSGGAYVEPNVVGNNNDKIYVSLNYLQNNRASYVRSYGASDQDTGEPTLYRFTPGDKLRVISYYTDEETIVYAPKGYDFDVVGVEEISPEQNNPLVDSSVDGQDSNEYILPRTGSFVLLKNNIQASGFTAADISGGVDKWGDRCIFEIVTQRKSRGEELKPYYETPFGGSIIVENGRKVHQYGTITIDQGDVYFRKVPVNMRAYDETSSSFTDIISVDESDLENSQARLRSYYLESQSVTDLYRSNAKNYGKAHFVIDGYSERINDSSIIYSDATNQESFNLFYTSFSPLVKNYFDLPAKYGDIDYIADAGDQLYVAQNSKIGKIQIDKSLTSTASGSDTLNLSREVLNSPRFFLEDVGTGGHPESVTWDDSTMYFVDQGRGVVVSAGEGGMKFLSSAGMEKFFKRLLAKYKNDSRIVTGVNPFKDELVVSVMANVSKNTASPAGLTTLTSSDPNTLSYDLATGDWITSYTFYSSEYANIGDRMISFKNKPDGSFVWRHDDGSKNSFYGISYLSMFTSVLVDNANMTKDFKSISMDGSKAWNLKLSTANETSTMTAFKNYEGTFYSEIGRSEGGSSKNNLKAVGTISSISQVSDSQFDIKFQRDISQYHVTLTAMNFDKASEVLFYDPNSSSITAEQFVGTDDSLISVHPIKIVNKYTLRVQFFGTPSPDNQQKFLDEYSTKGVIVSSNSRFFGDSLRDKFMTITAHAFPTSSTDKNELYSINIDYIESKLDSSR